MTVASRTVATGTSFMAGRQAQPMICSCGGTPDETVYSAGPPDAARPPVGGPCVSCLLDALNRHCGGGEITAALRVGDHAMVVEIPEHRNDQRWKAAAAPWDQAPPDWTRLQAMTIASTRPLVRSAAPPQRIGAEPTPTRTPPPATAPGRCADHGARDAGGAGRPDRSTMRRLGS